MKVMFRQNQYITEAQEWDEMGTFTGICLAILSGAFLWGLVVVLAVIFK